MSKRAKNHHIVPKVLQKQFTVQEDRKNIWRAKRGANGEFVSLERKKIAKTFVIKDYYTILENGRRSDLIEREFYAKIDDFLGMILPEVIQALDRGKVPHFSPEQLDFLSDATMQMAKRTPDFLPEHDDLLLGRNLIETTLQSLPNMAPHDQREQLEKELTNEVLLREKGRDIRVLATLHSSQPVNEALSQLVPRWAVSETDHSYILASRMVYRIGNGGPNGLSNPKMEMWMPVTPKIALVLLRDSENKIPLRVVNPPDHIRKVNEYAMRSSFEVASHSEALLKTLLRL